MKFSHAWLLDYVPLAGTPEAIGRRLTAAGVPLESIEGTPADPATVVYDLDVFTNRPDCMSHLGLARELAALEGATLRRPATAVPRGGPPTASRVAVSIEAEELCHRYSARAVLGVAVGPSPAWLRSRLELIGQRPVNNVVDATNYVLWETGQPMHPFDLSALAGGRIVVRKARAGETLETLDGVARRLAPPMLVIADAERPVALAGVMGGRSSEIRDTTSDVLLESAWFDPVSVRTTSKAFGLHTDASHRFERGADPAATLAALDRAAALIAELAGGTVTDPPLDVVARRDEPRRVAFRPARARALLGYDPGESAMRAILERLEFRVDPLPGGAWSVIVPTFRRDVEREVDLIEEVARHRGYDAIPTAAPALAPAASGRDDAGRAIGRARAALLQAGLTEAITFDLQDRDDCLAVDPTKEPVPILNPLQSNAACLRTTLLPGLLRSLAHNLNRGAAAVHLFEVGPAFVAAGEAPEERLHAAGVLAGRGLPNHWSAPAREVDLHDARGAVEALFGDRPPLPPRFSSDRIPGGDALRGLCVSSGEKTLGRLGEVAPALRRRFEIERPVFAFEIDLEPVVGAPRRSVRFRALPRHPAVRRDLAVLVEESVTWPAIEAAIRESSPVPITEIQVFDRYRGRGVPAGRASIALQIVFQHPDRTLAAGEVQAAQEAILEALGRRVGARLRGAHE